MAIITTDSKNYTDIAAAIRSKNGLATQYKPSEMAAAISAIESGSSSGDSYLNFDNLIPSDNYAKKIISGGRNGIDMSEFGINWAKVKYILIGCHNNGMSGNWGLLVSFPILIDNGNYIRTDGMTEVELLNHFTSTPYDRIFPFTWFTSDDTTFPRTGAEPDTAYRRILDFFAVNDSIGTLKIMTMYQTVSSSNPTITTKTIYPTFISIGWDD